MKINKAFYFYFFILSLRDNDFKVNEKLFNVLNNIENFNLRVKGKRSHL